MSTKDLHLVKRKADPKSHMLEKVSSFYKYVKGNYDLYLMVLPMVICYVLFMYKPMTGLIIAFQDYSPFKGISASPLVGLKHFKEFFTNPFAFRVIRNTFTISLSTLFFGFPIPIIFALLLNELRFSKFKKIVQTVSYLPHFISMVVVCSMLVSFMSPSTGIFNKIIEMFGGDPVYFLNQANLFVPIYVLLGIWKGAGYSSIVYIAAIISIPDEFYEAATVDGAGRWKQFLYITFPSLIPVMATMFLIKLGGILNVGYETIILLYTPSTYETADVINTYVYRTGILEGRYDYATAVGLMNSVVALILVVGANRISKKLTETTLW